MTKCTRENPAVNFVAVDVHALNSHIVVLELVCEGRGL